MNEQNLTVSYVFQNERDASILKCAVIMINQGRSDLAKNVLETSRIDASRLLEMQRRSTMVMEMNFGNTAKRSAGY